MQNRFCSLTVSATRSTNACGARSKSLTTICGASIVQSAFEFEAASGSGLLNRHFVNRGCSITTSMVSPLRSLNTRNHPFGGTTSLPPTERYFAGGSTTLRGFSFDDAVPEGGYAMTNGNFEYRT